MESCANRQWGDTMSYAVKALDALTPKNRHRLLSSCCLLAAHLLCCCSTLRRRCRAPVFCYSKVETPPWSPSNCRGPGQSQTPPPAAHRMAAHKPAVQKQAPLSVVA